MHEGNFTEQIVKAILEELNHQTDVKPKRVSVSVGEMLHLVPESVKLHFERLSYGTRLENVTLELKEIPVQIECMNCHKVGNVEDHHMLLCSDCGSRNVELLEGNKVTIDSIECD